ncbi:major facilitator superfamily domain-containing protein [Calycina marina]|uniref:Major facilitator superfamily domain-containing protein n=1 Tax=Calycina marina TaxID=1763456 RepID=A0A9P7Z3Q1_9HELO|nr:major facilitator superfamily domain-containing protein [Calycina marina]
MELIQDSKLHAAQAGASVFTTVTWYSDPGLRKLYYYCAVLCVVSATTGYDGMMLNTFQALDQWQEYFGHPKDSRLVPTATGCAVMVIGGFLGAFANGFGMYVGGRFILGFGNSLAQMASPVHLTEICHPQHRGKAVPAVIELAFIFWLLESPRWHMAHERQDEALSTLAKYHANGDIQNATVQFEYREIKETLRLEFEVKTNTSYIDFFKSKGNRYRFQLLLSLGIISQDSGNALFSNYINLIYEPMGIKEQNKKIPLNSGETILALVVSVSCAFVIDRVGRRPLFLTSTTGMVAMFLAWTITASQFEKTGDVKTTGYPQVVWVWIFGVFYSLAWSGLLVAYALEILHYKLRAKGLMIMNLTVQSALVLGNYTKPIACDRLPHHWNLSLIYTIWIFVELTFVYFFYVETRRPTLKELAKIFDGDDAAVAHVDMHEIEKEANLHDEKAPATDINRAV